MTVYNNKVQIQKHIKKLKSEGFTFGFVPTMGALHEGHLALVNEALLHNDFAVVSIFVNPTQFDNASDLKKYPRTLERDIELLQTQSEDIIVYAPSVDDIYEGQTTAERFNFDGLEHEMEGRFRDGHFDGVGTIVKRLFEIVTPNRAYFGEKDYQQLAIIKKLVEKHKLPVTIVGCAIYRDAFGLAMSSRNERLKPNYKKQAPFIYKTLQAAKAQFGIKNAKEIVEWVENEFANHKLLKLEYFIIADVKTLKPITTQQKNTNYRAFIAAYADDIRLIDNLALN
ncbi:pantoate--beta-alanine ligase [Bizionia gelidisalsuginis]|uniref:Pantothenate synthetase n=2 Tax=Bizionia TaxID=283785 RepID=A0A8H2LMR9_9FLAO|nr:MULTISPECIES: pantoate--beta-alanine ligase [Bizionia]TYB75996.1 pantoate--beta-alanine ligase [Bizionia saleffrena]TYC13499.1 pantoate--beta-alanine ligase [Bizionia gelidisalsuginis]